MTYCNVVRACLTSVSLAWMGTSLVLASELRLTDALSLAASQHPSIKAKQAELQAAQGDLATARWSR